MIDSLALTITLGSLLVALGALAVTVTRGFRTERFRGPLLVVELAVLVQAMLATIGLARGHRPPELSTFLAYLAFSVIVLPAAAAQVRGATGRWAGAAVACAFVVQAVVVVRLQTTWRTA